VDWGAAAIVKPLRRPLVRTPDVPFEAVRFASAGEMARFPPEEASPVALAPRIRVPVLLLHGAHDRETPPSHSARVLASLGGPHELVVLPGVGHDEILGREEAWRAIDAFLAVVAPRASRGAPSTVERSASVEPARKP
jgi:pimeloyl-ACP methyl ester carboxylesterase